MLVDDDTSEITIEDASVIEATGNWSTVEIPVSLSTPNSRSITVPYYTVFMPSPAADSSDFSASFGLNCSFPNLATITFTPGQITAPVNIDIYNDSLDEEDEPFGIELCTPMIGNLVAGSAVVTIVDDDAPPLFTINHYSSVQESPYGNQYLEVVISISSPSSKTVSLDWETASLIGPHLPQTHPATAGADFQLQGGTVTFAPGEVTKTIQVTILDDNVDEYDDEQLNIHFTEPTNAILNSDGWIYGWPVQNYFTTVNIQDNDEAPVVTISTPSAEITEGDQADLPTLVPFTVTLSAPSEKIISVDWNTRAAGTNPATADADYTAGSGTLTFNPGDPLFQSFGVDVLSDLIDEYDQEFAVELMNANNVTISTTGAAFANVTILDNDEPPTVSMSGPDNVTEADNQHNITFTVTLSAATEKLVTMDWTSDAPNTVGSPAIPNTDFKAEQSSLAFLPANAEMEKTFEVVIYGDTIDEMDEMFRVKLANVENATLLASTTQYVTIVDDDNLESPGTQTNPEGGVVSLPINGNSSNYNINGGTFSATGLPDGLTIDSTTGLITGRIKYTAYESQPNGLHPVTISLKLSPTELLSEMSFDWNVQNRSIQSLTLTEIFPAATVLPFSATTSLYGSEQFWIAPGNWVGMSLQAPTGGDLPTFSDVYVYSNGNINDVTYADQSIAQNATEDTYVIVGLDENLDGTLDFPTEKSFRITVRPISFAGAEITSTLNVEIEYEEKCTYCVTPLANSLGSMSDLPARRLIDKAPYNITLSGPSLGNLELERIRYQLDRLEWVVNPETGQPENSPATGSGGEYSKVFSVHEEDDYTMWYYIDSNGNGEKDTYEPSKHANFYVSQPRKELWQYRLDEANSRYDKYLFYEKFKIEGFITNLKNGLVSRICG